MSEPDIHDVATHISVLEERMNSYQAEYRADIAELAEGMAKRELRRIQHDATARRWQTAIIVVAVGVAATVLGIVLS